jgi:type IV secretion system protein VirD4
VKKLALILAILALSFASLIGGPTWLAHALAGDTNPAVTVAPPEFSFFSFPFYFVTSVEQFGPRLGRSAGLAAAGFALTFAGPAVGLGVVLLTKMYSQPKPREVGREKWMTPNQAEKAGLTAGRGVVLGQFGRGRWRRLLTFDGPEHQIVTGASRSGKGVGHVVPTLLSWHRSALVYDVKGELWQATSGWRSRFSHCVRFNPTDPTSARYNPLLEVRRGDCEVRDAQNIAEMLVDDGSGRPRSEPWDSETAQLLTATILHVLYAEPDTEKHLGRVRDLILDLDKSLDRMLATTHVQGDDGEAICHSEVQAVATHMKSQAPKFRDSVRGTASARLVLWADPIVRQVTSTSDFASGDLMCLDAPMSLYVQPPPADAARVRPLTRLMFHQMTRALMEHLDRDGTGRPKKHRLLLLLDEFPTLRKMEFVSEGLRQMAGYGIKTLIVAQSFQDIEEHYGAKQTIVDNCHVLVCFAAADVGTAQRISQMTGSATELRRSYGRSHFLDATKSVTYSESTRPLLMPGDVRELPYDTQLVFVTGHPPLRCRKVRHYRDRLFKSRLLPPPVQTVGKIDLPNRPPNGWAGVQSAASSNEHQGDETAPHEQWVDTDTGELIEGEAELSDSQKLHLLRLCPNGSLPHDHAPTEPASARRLESVSAAATVAAATSTPSNTNGDDTFLEELFS